MTRFAKLVLFLSSFSPLALLLAVRFLDEGAWPIFLVALSVIAGAAGFGLMEWARHGQADIFVIDAVESHAESLTGYLVGYLFPFLVLDPSDTLTVAASVLFLGLLAAIYVEGNLVYLNPLMLVKGRHLWHAEAHRRSDPGDKRTLMLLANADLLHAQDCVRATQIAGDVRLADVVSCDE